MKIIFSLNHFLPDRVAGIEVYTLCLSQALQTLGATVLVLVPHFEHKVNQEYLHEGIRVIRYATDGKHNGLESFIKIMADEKPDIWHIQELADGIGNGMRHLQAVRQMKIRAVITMHLSTYSCFTGNLFYKQQIACDGIIRISTCTECSYQAQGVDSTRAKVLKFASGLLYDAGIDISKKGGKLGTALGFPFLIAQKKQHLLEIADSCSKVVVLADFYKQILVANGIPEDKLFHSPQGLPGNISRKEKPTNLPLKFVFVGRVSKYKGVHLLIAAMQLLSPNQVTLDIYGPDSEGAYAKDCKHRSAGMSNIHWKGILEPEKVVPTLSGYDLLCLPSTFSEMSPLVIQEAFAAGIPVLASNVYGNAEQIEDGVNGWLFEFKNIQALQDKIQVLINKPELIDTAKGMLPATRSFELVAKEHVGLYENIINKKDVSPTTL